MPLASIPNDAILQALSYLGASDISAIYITGRVAVEDIPGLCASVGGEVFQNLLKKQTTPKKKNKNELAAGRALQTLRVAELVKILNGLNDAQESGTRGYWVSKSWAQQFRRYTEAQRLLLGTESASPNNGQRSRGRSRSSSSESLPPWPDANAELLCEHGSLGPRNGPRAKRLIVDRSTWRTIAYRFPLSTKLKVSSAADVVFVSKSKKNDKYDSKKKDHDLTTKNKKDYQNLKLKKKQRIPSQPQVYYDVLLQKNALNVVYLNIVLVPMLLKSAKHLVFVELRLYLLVVIILSRVVGYSCGDHH
eukprot:CAMPEP_0197317410 /NCGR_PEP_ID=MMETSP0891-20130614/46904_1 /TAXON_ID=44058 ORGANISM="Aureoumbra lagunensis, Strain CCMP1510" /NCGR_SAMPLE_ID=MMETSP0891 /ASSEMBLY_ACC=CAM_ASM_000534 /LENGTH=305 /DNA_ID=CAMNT_0042807393 /DNA_START=170 /DNA_END=1088 /DNA_ORIENTATION=-